MKLYQKYGLIPYLLINHLLIVLLLLLQIFNNFKEFRTLKRHHRHIYNLHDIDITANKFYIHNIEELRTHVKKTIGIFYSYKEKMIEEIEFTKNNNFNIVFIPSRRKTLNIVDLPFTETVSPFDDMSNLHLRKWLQFTEGFEIKLQYKAFFNYSRSTLCVVIDNTYHYDFALRGVYTFSIEHVINSCTNPEEYENGYMIERKEILPAIILVASISELIFVIYKIIYLSKIYYHLHNSPEFKSKLKNLEVKDKLKFFNLWLFLFVICDVLLIYSK